MSVVRVDIIDGPNIQAHGEYRGRAEVELSDGRIVRKRLSAPDQGGWDAVVAAIGARVLADETKRDAENAASPDTPIADTGYATKKARAYAYLQAAWRTEDAYEAYQLLDTFNSWRVQEGYSIAQVQAALASEGLTAEQWSKLSTAYQALSAGSQALIDAAAIQADWDDR